MPLVEAICTSCGGALQVDSTKEAAICPFCKKPYIVQDAVNNYVNNYVTNNTTNVEHLHADVVHIDDSRSAEQRLRAAEQQLRFGDYANALRIYKEVCEIAPNDYRCWWGCVRAETQENRRVYQGMKLEDLDNAAGSVMFYARRALMTAPAAEKPRILEGCDAFKASIAPAIQQLRTGILDEISRLEQMKMQFHAQAEQTSAERDAHDKRLEEKIASLTEQRDREQATLDKLHREKFPGDVPKFFEGPAIVTVLSYVAWFLIIAVTEWSDPDNGVFTKIIMSLFGTFLFGSATAIVLNLLRVLIRGIIRSSNESRRNQLSADINRHSELVDKANREIRVLEDERDLRDQRETTTRLLYGKWSESKENEKKTQHDLDWQKERIGRLDECLQALEQFTNV